MKTAVKVVGDWGVVMILELKDPDRVLIIDHEGAVRITTSNDDDFDAAPDWEIFA